MTASKFSKIFESAVKKDSTIVLKYRDSKGIVTAREVEPYKLEVDEDGKYGVFWGYDTRFDSIRKFYLERIEMAMITNRAFEARWPVEMKGKVIRPSDVGATVPINKVPFKNKED